MIYPRRSRRPAIVDRLARRAASARVPSSSRAVKVRWRGTGCFPRRQVSCSDENGEPNAATRQGANIGCSLCFPDALASTRGPRRRRCNLRRSYEYLLDCPLQQLGNSSVCYPKNLGRVRLQSSDLRVHAEDVQRRSPSLVGLPTGSAAENLGYAAGKLQRSSSQSALAQKIARLRAASGRTITFYRRGFHRAGRSEASDRSARGRGRQW